MKKTLQEDAFSKAIICLLKINENRLDIYIKGNCSRYTVSEE